MSLEESVYELDSDEEESNPRLEKFVRHTLECRSEELVRELRSLDRKADRARSDRGKRMMVKREEGSVIPESLHSYPKRAPIWALCAALQRR